MLTKLSTIILIANILTLAAANEFCGVRDESQGLILNGTQTKRGAYPWLVALLNSTNNKFFCAGVLITKTRVVTAAHCMHQKRTRHSKVARDIFVRVGAFDLSNSLEPVATTIPVKEVNVHPTWNPWENSYHADIAFLTLIQETVYSMFVRPICLSSEPITGDEGFVAGWGKSENANKSETIPREVTVPIVRNEVCIYKKRELSTIASPTTMCAGGKDRKGPCTGDSGGGLYLKIDNVFYLKGIVSSSLTDYVGQCDVSTYALYTDIDTVHDWVEDPKNFVENSKATKTRRCGLMSRNKDVTREHFPWMVLIKLKPRNNDPAYFSTGTLISERHVITTGFFVSDLDLVAEKITVRDPDDFVLYFGVESRENLNPQGSVQVEGIEKVVVHPDLKVGFPSSANIAVLKMKNPLEQTPHIYWICLTRNTIQDRHENQTVFEVGWGQDRGGKISKSRRSNTMKITSRSVCEKTWGEFLGPNVAAEYFCASRSGENPECNSKTPLYQKEGENWVLRSLFSFSMSQSDKSCDLSKPLMFEDMGKYYSWISTEIKKKRNM